MEISSSGAIGLECSDKDFVAMPHACVISRLAAVCLLTVAAGGCTSTRSASLAGNSNSSWLAWFQPKLRLPDGPPPIQVPDKLKDERDLTLKYARWMVSSGTQQSLQEATRKYQELLKKDPRDVDAIVGLASVHQLTGRSGDAEAAFRKAVQIAPESALTQSALGQFLGSQGRWTEATDCYNRAVLADPTDRNSRFQLAVALVHDGNVEVALTHFIGVDGDARAHFDAAVILKQDGRLEEAESQLKIALAKKPQLLEARQLLAEISPALPQKMVDRAVVPTAHYQGYSLDRRPVVSPGSRREPIAAEGHVTTAGHSVAG